MYDVFPPYQLPSNCRSPVKRPEVSPFSRDSARLPCTRGSGVLRTTIPRGVRGFCSVHSRTAGRANGRGSGGVGARTNAAPMDHGLQNRSAPIHGPDSSHRALCGSASLLLDASPSRANLHGKSDSGSFASNWRLYQIRVKTIAH